MPKIMSDSEKHFQVPGGASDNNAESEVTPLAVSEIKAGFPSPAADYSVEGIDLNKMMVAHKASTFFARVSGDSMSGAGILDGDMVVIDRSLDAHSGDCVAAFIDGEFTMKTFRIDENGDGAWLIPANPAYTPIHVTGEDDFRIWGVVTGVVRKLR